MTNLLVTLLAFVLRTAPSADVSGVWTIDFDPDLSGHRTSHECILKEADKKLTGDCGTDTPHPVAIGGKVEEPNVIFHFKTGRNNDVSMTLTAELDDQARTMTGRWYMADGDGNEGTGKFQARKR